MALIKCPECGKQFSEYAAFCPQCGMPIKDVLPLINHQQNHSTLGNASQNVQTYIVHSCPDCGHEMIDLFDFCPICGCPKEHFIGKVKVTNNSSVQATYICPDCGNKMDNNQSNCPNCDCPKELLTKENQILQSTDNNDKKNKGPLILTILVVIALISVSIHLFKKIQAEEHRQQQEQYERNERNARIERERVEESNRQQKERENKDKMRKISSHPWKYINGDVLGHCVLTVVWFKSDGTGSTSVQYFVGGNRMNANSFNFNYYIDGNRVYVLGDYTFDFDGDHLISRGGEEYISGSLLY